jgi:hypothetical protein
VSVGLFVEVGGGAQPLSGALYDPAAFAEYLAGDLDAFAHGLGDHCADPGAVAAGVRDEVLAGRLQLLAAVGQLAAEAAEFAARPT